MGAILDLNKEDIEILLTCLNNATIKGQDAEKLVELKKKLIELLPKSEEAIPQSL